MGGWPYNHKNRLLKYVTDPENWENRFDIRVFDDPTRWWKHTSNKGITIKSSEEAQEAVATHTEYCASVSFDFTNNAVTIEDESGRQLVYKNQTLEGEDCSFSAIKSETEIGLNDPNVSACEIPYTPFLVRFNPDGTKTVFFDSLGQRADFEKPFVKLENKPIRTRHFHTITFNRAARWDLNHIKLIFREIGVDENLKAYNGLDPQKAHLWMSQCIQFEKQQEENLYAKNLLPWHESQRPAMPEDFEKEWHGDTAQFTGPYVGLSSKFMVAMTETDYEVSTGFDGREIPLIQGPIHRSSAKDKPVQLHHAITQSSLLDLLQSAPLAKDFRGLPWKCAVVKGGKAPILANTMRKIMRQNFGLSAHEYFAITVGPSLCRVAVRGDALAKTQAAYNASMEMISLIDGASNDISRMHELYAQGANLRYVDYRAAEQNNTFANKMLEAGCYELLGAMKERYGLHELRKFEL